MWLGDVSYYKSGRGNFTFNILKWSYYIKLLFWMFNKYDIIIQT